MQAMATSTQQRTHLGENAFPKISGKTKDFLKQLQSLKAQGTLPDSLPIHGTVKLHGSHADIVFDLRDDEHGAVFQSRNRICASTDSQQGWPRNLAKHDRELVSLKQKILVRFIERNADVPLDMTKPLIIAGEWIGPKVQRDVGVSKLSHRFVILAIQLNGIWQNDNDFGDIDAPEAAIYNVLSVLRYTVIFDTVDLTIRNSQLLEMQKLADEVEAHCPFAAHYGIQGSRGEGIVWKPDTLECQADAKYWLKTKGPLIGPENRIQFVGLADAGAASEQSPITVKDVEKLAATWVSNRRIEQALEYLAEMNTQEQNRPKEFRKWIMEDILKEESTAIEEVRISMPGVEQVLRKCLGKLASEEWKKQI